MPSEAARILPAVDTAGWAELGSAAFTALAAGAAWAAVWQAGRERRESQRPALAVEVIAQLPSRELFVHISNEGGPARRALLVLVEGQVAHLGNVPPTSFVRSGESRRLKIDTQAANAEQATAVVIAFDMPGRWVYGTAANGEQHRWRVKPSWRYRRDLSAEMIFRHFYPNAPDPLKLPKVGCSLVERS